MLPVAGGRLPEFPLLPCQPALSPARVGRQPEKLWEAGSDALGQGLESRRYSELLSRLDALNQLATATRESGELPFRKVFPPYPPEQRARLNEIRVAAGLDQAIQRMLDLGTPEFSRGAISAAENDALALSEVGGAWFSQGGRDREISVNRPVLEWVAQVESV